jgi:hypothetical protein
MMLAGIVPGCTIVLPSQANARFDTHRGRHWQCLRTPYGNAPASAQPLLTVQQVARCLQRPVAV